MNVLSNLTIKNLKLNKARTIVTIIGIILSTALLVALSGLVSSFLHTMEVFEIESNGPQHVVFLNVPKDELSAIELHKETESYYLYEVIGYFEYEENSDVENAIIAMDENALMVNENKLSEGRLPENSGEILLSDDYVYDEVKIGDTFTLPSGEAYEVVGKIRGTKAVNFSNPIILYMDEVQKSAHIAVTYTHPMDYEKITESIVGEAVKYNYSYNEELLRYQTGKMSESTSLVIYSMGFIVAFIIMLTSVFCIRNSFAISITEKIRQYGMLASVGATPKQIRKNVLFEALILGLIAIPIGVLSGLLAVVLLIQTANNLLYASLTTDSYISLYISPSFVLIAIFLSSITIYLSSISSAKRASKISEIEAIYSTQDIRIKSKSLKTPKFISNIFGIGGTFAHKNIKRNKKKFRTTTISLIVSIATFIALSSFVDLGFQMSKIQFSELNFTLQIAGEDLEKIYDEVQQLEGITEKTYRISYPMFYRLNEDYGYLSMDFYTLDDEYYEKYLAENNIEYEENKFVLLDKTYYETEENRLKIINLVESDSELTVFNTNIGEEDSVTLDFVRPDFYPMGLEEINYLGIIMSSSQFEKYAVNDEIINYEYIFIDSENSNEIEKALYKYAEENDFDIDIANVEDYQNAQDSTLLLVGIFLYGFITVIILVGLTNIFNSLSTNMNLRRKEFATLISIGMTKKEFSNMINFECITYVLKSLLLGIPIGVLGSFALYNASSYGTLEYVFNFPIKQIVIASVLVFFIVYAIMKSSLSKITKQNIIETIRNENI
ncbi:MAG: FtsX-like permease family protein [Clostridia bacterium]